MISEEVEREVDDFLAGVVLMNEESLANVKAHGIAQLAIVEPAQSAITLGAADFSWLNKRVRDALRPLLMSRDLARFGLTGSVKPYVLQACQAMIRRSELTADQYEAFVGGYRQAGVRVPDYGAAE